MDELASPSNPDARLVICAVPDTDTAALRQALMNWLPGVEIHELVSPADELDVALYTTLDELAPSSVATAVVAPAGLGAVVGAAVAEQPRSTPIQALWVPEVEADRISIPNSNIAVLGFDGTERTLRRNLTATLAHAFALWRERGRAHLTESVDRDYRLGNEIWHGNLLNALRCDVVPTLDAAGQLVEYPVGISPINPQVPITAQREQKVILGFAIAPEPLWNKPHRVLRLLPNLPWIVQRFATANNSRAETGEATVWGQPSAAFLDQLCGPGTPQSITLAVSREIGTHAVLEFVRLLAARDWVGHRPKITVDIGAGGRIHEARKRLADQLRADFPADRKKRHGITVEVDERVDAIGPAVVGVDWIAASELVSEPDLLVEAVADGFRAEWPEGAQARRGGSGSAARFTGTISAYPQLSDVCYIFCSNDIDGARSALHQFLRNCEARDYRACTPSDLAETVSDLIGASTPPPIVVVANPGDAIPTRIAIEQLGPRVARALAGFVVTHDEAATLRATMGVASSICTQTYASVPNKPYFTNPHTLYPLRDALSRQHELAGEYAETAEMLAALPATPSVAPLVDALRNENLNAARARHFKLDGKAISPWVATLAARTPTVVDGFLLVRGFLPQARDELLFALPSETPEHVRIAATNHGSQHHQAWVAAFGNHDTTNLLGCIRAATPTRKIRLLVGRGRDAALVTSLVETALADTDVMGAHTQLEVTFEDLGSQGHTESCERLVALAASDSRLAVRTKVLHPVDRRLLKPETASEQPIAMSFKPIMSREARTEAIVAAAMRDLPVVPQAAATTDELPADPVTWPSNITKARRILVVCTQGKGPSVEASVSFVLAEMKDKVAVVGCRPSQLGDVLTEIRSRRGGGKRPTAPVAVMADVDTSGAVHRIVRNTPHDIAPDALWVDVRWWHKNARRVPVIASQPLIYVHGQDGGMTTQNAWAAFHDCADNRKLRNEFVTSDQLAAMQEQPSKKPAKKAAKTHPAAALFPLAHDVLEREKDLPADQPRLRLLVTENAMAVVKGALYYANEREVRVAPVDDGSGFREALLIPEPRRRHAGAYVFGPASPEELRDFAASGTMPYRVTFVVDDPAAVNDVFDAAVLTAQHLITVKPSKRASARKVSIVVGDGAVAAFKDSWQELKYGVNKLLPIEIVVGDDESEKLTLDDGALRPSVSAAVEQYSGRPRPWAKVTGPEIIDADRVLVICPPTDHATRRSQLNRMIGTDVPPDVAIIRSDPKDLAAVLELVQAIRAEANLGVIPVDIYAQRRPQTDWRNIWTALDEARAVRPRTLWMPADTLAAGQEAVRIGQPAAITVAYYLADSTNVPLEVLHNQPAWTAGPSRSTTEDSVAPAPPLARPGADPWVAVAGVPADEASHVVVLCQPQERRISQLANLLPDEAAATTSIVSCTPRKLPGVLKRLREYHRTDTAAVSILFPAGAAQSEVAEPLSFVTRQVSEVPGPAVEAVPYLPVEKFALLSAYRILDGTLRHAQMSAPPPIFRALAGPPIGDAGHIFVVSGAWDDQTPAPSVASLGPLTGLPDHDDRIALLETSESELARVLPILERRRRDGAPISVFCWPGHGPSLHGVVTNADGTAEPLAPPTMLLLADDDAELLGSPLVGLSPLTAAGVYPTDDGLLPAITKHLVAAEEFAPLASAIADSQQRLAHYDGPLNRIVEQLRGIAPGGSAITATGIVKAKERAELAVLAGSVATAEVEREIVFCPDQPGLVTAMAADSPAIGTARIAIFGPAKPHAQLSHDLALTGERPRKITVVIGRPDALDAVLWLTRLLDREHPSCWLAAELHCAPSPTVEATYAEIKAFMEQHNATLDAGVGARAPMPRPYQIESSLTAQAPAPSTCIRLGGVEPADASEIVVVARPPGERLSKVRQRLGEPEPGVAVVSCDASQVNVVVRYVAQLAASERTVITVLARRDSAHSTPLQRELEGLAEPHTERVDSLDRESASVAVTNYVPVARATSVAGVLSEIVLAVSPASASALSTGGPVLAESPEAAINRVLTAEKPTAIVLVVRDPKARRKARDLSFSSLGPAAAVADPDRVASGTATIWECSPSALPAALIELSKAHPGRPINHLMAWPGSTNSLVAVLPQLDSNESPLPTMVWLYGDDLDDWKRRQEDHYQELVAALGQVLPGELGVCRYELDSYGRDGARIGTRQARLRRRLATRYRPLAVRAAKERQQLAKSGRFKTETAQMRKGVFLSDGSSWSADVQQQIADRFLVVTDGSDDSRHFAVLPRVDWADMQQREIDLAPDASRILEVTQQAPIGIDEAFIYEGKVPFASVHGDLRGKDAAAFVVKIATLGTPFEPTVGDIAPRHGTWLRQVTLRVRSSQSAACVVAVVEQLRGFAEPPGVRVWFDCAATEEIQYVTQQLKSRADFGRNGVSIGVNLRPWKAKRAAKDRRADPAGDEVTRAGPRSEEKLYHSTATQAAESSTVLAEQLKTPMLDAVPDNADHIVVACDQWSKLYPAPESVEAEPIATIVRAASSRGLTPGAVSCRPEDLAQTLRDLAQRCPGAVLSVAGGLAAHDAVSTLVQPGSKDPQVVVAPVLLWLSYEDAAELANPQLPGVTALAIVSDFGEEGLGEAEAVFYLNHIDTVAALAGQFSTERAAAAAGGQWAILNALMPSNEPALLTEGESTDQAVAVLSGAGFSLSPYRTIVFPKPVATYLPTPSTAWEGMASIFFADSDDGVANAQDLAVRLVDMTPLPDPADQLTLAADWDAAAPIVAELAEQLGVAGQQVTVYLPTEPGPKTTQAHDQLLALAEQGRPITVAEVPQAASDKALTPVSAIDLAVDPDDRVEFSQELGSELATQVLVLYPPSEDGPAIQAVVAAAPVGTRVVESEIGRLGDCLSIERDNNPQLPLMLAIQGECATALLELDGAAVMPDVVIMSQEDIAGAYGETALLSKYNHRLWIQPFALRDGLRPRVLERACVTGGNVRYERELMALGTGNPGQDLAEFVATLPEDCRVISGDQWLVSIRGGLLGSARRVVRSAALADDDTIQRHLSAAHHDDTDVLIMGDVPSELVMELLAGSVRPKALELQINQPTTALVVAQALADLPERYGARPPTTVLRLRPAAEEADGLFEILPEDNWLSVPVALKPQIPDDKWILEPEEEAPVEEQAHVEQEASAEQEQSASPGHELIHAPVEGSGLLFPGHSNEPRYAVIALIPTDAELDAQAALSQLLEEDYREAVGDIQLAESANLAEAYFRAYAGLRNKHPNVPITVFLPAGAYQPVLAALATVQPEARPVAVIAARSDSVDPALRDWLPASVVRCVVPYDVGRVWPREAALRHVIIRLKDMVKFQKVSRRSLRELSARSEPAVRAMFTSLRRATVVPNGWNGAPQLLLDSLAFYSTSRQGHLVTGFIVAGGSPWAAHGERAFVFDKELRFDESIDPTAAADALTAMQRSRWNYGKCILHIAGTITTDLFLDAALQGVHCRTISINMRDHPSVNAVIAGIDSLLARIENQTSSRSRIRVYFAEWTPTLEEAYRRWSELADRWRGTKNEDSLLVFVPGQEKPIARSADALTDAPIVILPVAASDAMSISTASHDELGLLFDADSGAVMPPVIASAAELPDAYAAAYQRVVRSSPNAIVVALVAKGSLSAMLDGIGAENLPAALYVDAADAERNSAAVPRWLTVVEHDRGARQWVSESEAVQLAHSGGFLKWVAAFRIGIQETRADGLVVSGPDRDSRLVVNGNPYLAHKTRRLILDDAGTAQQTAALPPGHSDIYVTSDYSTFHAIKSVLTLGKRPERILLTITQHPLFDSVATVLTKALINGSTTNQAAGEPFIQIDVDFPELPLEGQVPALYEKLRALELAGKPLSVRMKHGGVWVPTRTPRTAVVALAVAEPAGTAAAVKDELTQAAPRNVALTTAIAPPARLAAAYQQACAAIRAMYPFDISVTVVVAAGSEQAAQRVLSAVRTEYRPAQLIAAEPIELDEPLEVVSYFQHWPNHSEFTELVRGELLPKTHNRQAARTRLAAAPSADVGGRNLDESPSSSLIAVVSTSSEVDGRALAEDLHRQSDVAQQLTLIAATTQQLPVELRTALAQSRRKRPDADIGLLIADGSLDVTAQALLTVPHAEFPAAIIASSSELIRTPSVNLLPRWLARIARYNHQHSFIADYEQRWEPLITQAGLVQRDVVRVRERLRNVADRQLNQWLSPLRAGVFVPPGFTEPWQADDDPDALSPWVYALASADDNDEPHGLVIVRNGVHRLASRYRLLRLNSGEPVDCFSNPSGISLPGYVVADVYGSVAPGVAFHAMTDGLAPAGVGLKVDEHPASATVGADITVLAERAMQIGGPTVHIRYASSLPESFRPFATYLNELKARNGPIAIDPM